MKKIAVAFLLFVPALFCRAQTTDDYETFRQSIMSDFRRNREEVLAGFNSYRDSLNRAYSDFLRNTWSSVESRSATPLPVDPSPVEPPLYNPSEDPSPVVVIPREVPAPSPLPRPHPVEPVRETPRPEEKAFSVSFYGIDESVRLPSTARVSLPSPDGDLVASAWEDLSCRSLDNALADCLRIRDQYDLCDWAYLEFLHTLSSRFCTDSNGATLLAAFLYCQSGYQMRLARDGARLVLLYGSRNHVFETPYYVLDGKTFYTYGTPASALHICDAAYQGERPMSLLIEKEPKLGGMLSPSRKVSSTKYPDMAVTSRVPEQLIKFYSGYPTAEFDGKSLSRWAMYAETPFAARTSELLYPALREKLEGLSKLDAVNRLLNLVQTGFEYELDDNVWGRDRAFFAEETLYYPYSDCEDRSILFSRLVRDLVGLDVALVSYPGHLATAVKFDTDVDGSCVMIGNDRYVVCDPTFIGAPAGRQMPGLDYSQTEAIVLRR